MTRDQDLDVMNGMKDLPEKDAAFYFRSGDDSEGFYYYTGTVEDMGNTL